MNAYQTEPETTSSKDVLYVSGFAGQTSRAGGTRRVRRHRPTRRCCCRRRVLRGHHHHRSALLRESYHIRRVTPVEGTFPRRRLHFHVRRFFCRSCRVSGVSAGRVFHRRHHPSLLVIMKRGGVESLRRRIRGIFGRIEFRKRRTDAAYQSRLLVVVVVVSFGMHRMVEVSESVVDVGFGGQWPLGHRRRHFLRARLEEGRETSGAPQSLFLRERKRREILR